MNKKIRQYYITIALGVNILAFWLFIESKENPVVISTEHPSIVQRNELGIDPFAVAARAELISYTNRMDWWFDGSETDKPVLKDGILNIPADSIHSRLEMDATAIANWQSALYVQQLCDNNVITLCYEPRHMLLFYDTANNLFGYVEICLTCARGQISEGFRKVDFCVKRVEYLAKLLL